MQKAYMKIIAAKNSIVIPKSVENRYVINISVNNQIWRAIIKPEKDGAKSLEALANLFLIDLIFLSSLPPDTCHVSYSYITYFFISCTLYMGSMLCK